MSHRPLSFTVQQSDESPGRWRELLAAIADWRAAGADVSAQTAVRPIGVVAGLTSTVNPLRCSRTYKALSSLPLAERVARMQDPAVRETILNEHGSFVPSSFSATTHSGYDRMYPMAEFPNYEPQPEDSLAGIAARADRPANEVMYDFFTDNGGTQSGVPAVHELRGRQPRRRRRDDRIAADAVRPERCRCTLQHVVRWHHADHGDQPLDP